jgi:hypothetical protein
MEEDGDVNGRSKRSMIRKDASGSCVALAWYRPEEWKKLRAVAVDGLEATYEEWVAHAEMALREAVAAGLDVVKVPVAVGDLVAWCAAEGLAVDGQARARFAAEQARTGS